MISYEPPFKITAKAVNLVSEISRMLGRLDKDLMQMSPQLRKKNRIKTITGTLAIEGNTMTEEQISGVIEGKAVMGSYKELAEVNGAIKAYDAIDILDPYSVDDLLKAHGLMMTEIINDAGQFRTKAVGVHKDNKMIHVAPQAKRVYALMSDLLSWARDSEHHPLIVSSVFHYELEFIHPFTDGNGRMGRLWQTLILSKWNKSFAMLPVESIIKAHQQDYYNVLELSDHNGDCTLFIEFMLQRILHALKENAPVNAPQNAPVNASINYEQLSTADAIIELIKRNNEINRQEMAELLNKDLRTIGRAIKKLREHGRLQRVGSAKDGYWELL
jgi:Fic family protein